MNDYVKFNEVNDEQEFRIKYIREIYSTIFDEIENVCNKSRETSLGITKLEESMFWIIKGISREEKRTH